MTDIYARAAALTQRMLKPTSEGGYGQGSIVLIRLTPGDPPANAWDPPADPISVRTTLRGAASGVSKELVGVEASPGTTIVATDLQIIVAPWGGAYEPGDILELDGAPLTILAVRNIPAVGTVAAIKFVARR